MLVEVNATPTRHISSRSASPAGDEQQGIIPPGETGGDTFPAPVVVRPKSESPVAAESDEEILIVESEVCGSDGGPADADRSSPARNA